MILMTQLYYLNKIIIFEVIIERISYFLIMIKTY
jgi:hypothetical protein